MEQVQKQHSTQKKEEVQVDEVKKTDEKTTALKKEIDDLLDEIDTVLEEEAEAFVKSYIQRGGQ